MPKPPIAAVSRRMNGHKSANSARQQQSRERIPPESSHPPSCRHAAEMTGGGSTRAKTAPAEDERAD
jgi:hypothetical protein